MAGPQAKPDAQRRGSNGRGSIAIGDDGECRREAGNSMLVISLSARTARPTGMLKKAAHEPKRLIAGDVSVTRNRLCTGLSTESVREQMQAKYLVGWLDLHCWLLTEKKDAARRWRRPAARAVARRGEGLLGSSCGRRSVIRAPFAAGRRNRSTGVPDRDPESRSKSRL